MHDDFIPTESGIYGWIERVFAQGIRRPGYRADVWTEDFCFDQFTKFGVQKVRREPVELLRWEPRSATLIVRSPAGETIEIACFPVPLAKPTPGLDARLVAFDRENATAVSGAASLYAVPLLNTPFGFFSHI